MASFIYVQVLWLIPLFCASQKQGSSPVLDFFELEYIRDEYEHTEQCSENNTVIVNDYAKILTINCNGSEANTSNLPNCTRLPRISGIAFMDCKLPTPNIASLVKEFKLQALLYLTLRFPLVQKEVTVKDLDSIVLLGLSITNTSNYILQNLPAVRQVDMIFPDIDVFPANLLSNLSLVDKIYLANGRIGSLPPTTFRGLSRLTVLNLYNNKLNVLPDTLFEGLRLLLLLSLSYNRLEVLPFGIFKDLIRLEEILLSGNHLVQLHPTLLSSQRNLKNLDISNNNNLVTVPEELFENSLNLRSFYASSCGLKFIPEKLFAATSSLSLVLLNNNKISSIPKNLFVQNPLLTSVDLSGNQLQVLPQAIFQRNYEIEEILLDNNIFTKIPVEALLEAKSLSALYLRNNSIMNADEPQLGSLVSLRIIALDGNNLSSFRSPTPFGMLRQLFYLGLSFNNFNTFPKLYWKAYAITTLVMNNNKIFRLSIDSLPPGNVTVDLRFNKIKSVSLSIKSANSSKKTGQIYLGSNPFMCDCNLRDFLQALHKDSSASKNSITVIDADELTCFNPSHWKSQNLLEISPLYHLCPVSSSCPEQCRCYQLKELTRIVNCSSLGLSTFPNTLPTNTSIVHLEDNSITEFSIINVDYWENVTHLYLDGNRLVSPKLWPNLNIRYLSLRNNHLVQLSDNLTEYITDASQFILDIRDNSWICNCTYISFKSWLVRNKEKLVLPEEIACIRTVMSNGTLVLYPILKVPDDAFCPFDSATRAVQVTIAVFSSCCLCIAAVTLIILRFGNKRTVLAFLYAYFPNVFPEDLSDTERNKRYDAFISYTSSDRKEVLTILNELEEKPPHFTFCVHERDWLPGYPIISQIEVSVQNSVKTIIFLSKQFLESFWCEIEFQTAYLQSLEDKIDKMIIIVKGDLPDRDSMPLDMQNLLATKTFLVWGERWFWEKLNYALPHSVRAEKIVKKELMVEGMIQEFRNNKIV